MRTLIAQPEGAILKGSPSSNCVIASDVGSMGVEEIGTRSPAWWIRQITRDRQCAYAVIGRQPHDRRIVVKLSGGDADLAQRNLGQLKILCAGGRRSLNNHIGLPGDAQGNGHQNNPEGRRSCQPPHLVPPFDSRVAGLYITAVRQNPNKGLDSLPEQGADPRQASRFGAVFYGRACREDLRVRRSPCNGKSNRGTSGHPDLDFPAPDDLTAQPPAP